MIWGYRYKSSSDKIEGSKKNYFEFIFIRVLKVKKRLTRKGFQKIAEEHRQLFEEERPKVVDGIAIAAAEGDRSENAEYIYGKKRLREIDKRLRYLTGLMKDVKIIDPENIRSDRVCFGATVVIEDEEQKRKEWMIVGVGEADVSEGTISYQSPMAKALMDKKEGDFALIKKPSGETEVEIIDIKFEGKSWREFYSKK